MKQYRILVEIITLVPIIPIYYYGKKVYSNLEKELKIYWIFLLFAFVVQLGILITGRLGIRNVFVGSLFQIIEYIVLSVIFYRWNSSKLIRFLIPLFIIVNVSATLYFLTGRYIDYSSTIDKYLRNFVLIPLSFYTAFTYSVKSQVDMLKDIKFWIIGGILVNVTLTSFTQLIHSYSIKNYELNLIFNMVLLATNTISYIMFIKGFICLKAQLKYTGS